MPIVATTTFFIGAVVALLGANMLTDFGAIPVAERVVRDRNRISGGGVTAGIDFGLTDQRIDLVREGVDLAIRLAPLADSSLKLRTLGHSHRLLVASVARKTGVDHRRLNAELIARTGGRVDQATTEQLQKRIQLLERWQEKGYDGKR